MRNHFSRVFVCFWERRIAGNNEEVAPRKMPWLAAFSPGVNGFCLWFKSWTCPLLTRNFSFWHRCWSPGENASRKFHPVTRRSFFGFGVLDKKSHPYLWQAGLHVSLFFCPGCDAALWPSPVYHSRRGASGIQGSDLNARLSSPGPTFRTILRVRLWLNCQECLRMQKATWCSSDVQVRVTSTLGPMARGSHGPFWFEYSMCVYVYIYMVPPKKKHAPRQCDDIYGTLGWFPPPVRAPQFWPRPTMPAFAHLTAPPST